MYFEGGYARHRSFTSMSFIQFRGLLVFLTICLGRLWRGLLARRGTRLPAGDEAGPTARVAAASSEALAEARVGLGGVGSKIIHKGIPWVSSKQKGITVLCRNNCPARIWAFAWAPPLDNYVLDNYLGTKPCDGNSCPCRAP